MRGPRFTYSGAFHHCMNRGHNGESILVDDVYKQAFLNMLAEKVIKYRMRLFAYCLMDNHYHLVLQNASGRMSDFFRNLNTQYAFYYRERKGGEGYVFQNRFHSTIIGDNEYLRMAILYVLANPMRAGLVERFDQYQWSSGGAYWGKNEMAWLDGDFVRKLFGGWEMLATAFANEKQVGLPLKRTPLGLVLGGEEFFRYAFSKFDRRRRADAVQKRRHDDYDFDPVEKVIREFEQKYNAKMDELAVGQFSGKRLRAELLVRLRDLAGLTYRQISEISIFSDLQYGSLRQIYLNFKRKNVRKD